MKRFISLFLVLLLILSLSACSCNIDWSKFDLTKHNFGLTEDKNSAVSDADFVSNDSLVTDDNNENFSEAVLNYTVPEKSGVIYEQWNVVDPENFDAMAEEKLLDCARLISELTSMKTKLSEYSSVYRLAADENFVRILNGIRAWSYGARNYPTEGLSQNDIAILEAFVTLGMDLSEYGARFPSLIVTNDAETIASYEDLIISQTVRIDELINAVDKEQK